MTNELQGKKVAFLVANSGVEQIELTRSWEDVKDAGGQPTLIAPESGQVQAFNSDVEKADQFPVDLAVSDASVVDYDALVLPGGTTNADKLRMVPEAVALVKGFVDSSKPVAAVCHGPWSLVEAGVVQGKTLTSWPSLQTDIRNAGGTWVDEEVFVCPTNGWTLITSRKPEDLDAFSKAIVEEFSKSRVAAR
ncbi:MAG: protease [Acidimicrobiales bacterium]|nr:MAG: protease [Acidimicrobiales bacterium]